MSNLGGGPGLTANKVGGMNAAKISGEVKGAASQGGPSALESTVAQQTASNLASASEMRKQLSEALGFEVSPTMAGQMQGVFTGAGNAGQVAGMGMSGGASARMQAAMLNEAKNNQAMADFIRRNGGIENAAKMLSRGMAGGMMKQSAEGMAAWQAFGSNQTFSDYMKGIEAGLHSTAGQGATLAAIAAQHGGSYQALARAAGGMNAANQGAALARLNSVMTAMGMKGVSISGGKDGSIVARAGDAMVATIASNGAITIAGNGEVMKALFDNGMKPPSMAASQEAAFLSRGGSVTTVLNPHAAAANLNGGGLHAAAVTSAEHRGGTQVNQGSTTNQGISVTQDANLDGQAAANDSAVRDAISHYAGQIAHEAAAGNWEAVQDLAHRAGVGLMGIASDAMGVDARGVDSESNKTALTSSAGVSGNTSGRRQRTRQGPGQKLKDGGHAGSAQNRQSGAGLQGDIVGRFEDARTKRSDFSASAFQAEIERNARDITQGMQQLHKTGEMSGRPFSEAAYQSYIERALEHDYAIYKAHVENVSGHVAAAADNENRSRGQPNPADRIIGDADELWDAVKQGVGNAVENWLSPPKPPDEP